VGVELPLDGREDGGGRADDYSCDQQSVYRKLNETTLPKHV